MYQADGPPAEGVVRERSTTGPLCPAFAERAASLLFRRVFPQQERGCMAIPYLTEEQIRQIRIEWDAGRIDTRAWAEALDVSMETIRRIGRRDTYRKLAKGAEGMRARPQVVNPMSGEPTGPDVAASLAKFMAIQEAEQKQPRQVDEMLREMRKGPLDED